MLRREEWALNIPKKLLWLEDRVLKIPKTELWLEDSVKNT